MKSKKVLFKINFISHFFALNKVKVTCCTLLGKFDNQGRCNRLKVTRADYEYGDGNGLYESTGQTKGDTTHSNLGGGVRTVSSRLVYKHVDLNLDR